MQDDAATDHARDRKILGPLGMKMRLIGVSGAVLLVGAVLAPASENLVPSRTEERANPLLEEQVAATAPPPAPFSGVQAAADAPRAHVVQILPERPPVLESITSDVPYQAPFALVGAGVVVSDAYVLTHAAALDGRVTARLVMANGRTADAQVAAHDPSSGLVLLRTSGGLAPPAVLASAPPPAGALAVAVGHAAGRPIALPVFVTIVNGDVIVVTPAGPGGAPGLPLFTVDGSLVGVLGPDGSGEVVRAAGPVDRLIARAASGEVTRSFGLAVQRIDGALSAAFAGPGVLVSDVVPLGPAALAGVAPGDVLTGVGDTAVTTIEGARDALAAAAAAASPDAMLHLVRRGRTRDVAVTAVSSFATAHLARLDPRRDSGIAASVVLPPQLLASAGLPSRAQLLSLNGVVATTRAQAERALAGRRAADVLHVRDERGAYFVAVETAR